MALSNRNATDDRMVVHTFQRNTNEQVRASIRTYKGKDYADVRVNFETADGEYRPTKKGLTVPLDLLDELEQTVMRLQRAAKHSERGAQ